MPNAYSIKVRGVVQGVGFRPFVYRLARANGLTGWVLNAEEGAEIHLEGGEQPVRIFLEELESQPPPAASIVAVGVSPAVSAGFTEFEIRASKREKHFPAFASRPTYRFATIASANFSTRKIRAISTRTSTAPIAGHDTPSCAAVCRMIAPTPPWLRGCSTKLPRPPI